MQLFVGLTKTNASSILSQTHGHSTQKLKKATGNVMLELTNSGKAFSFSYTVFLISLNLIFFIYSISICSFHYVVLTHFPVVLL